MKHALIAALMLGAAALPAAAAGATGVDHPVDRRNPARHQCDRRCDAGPDIAIITAGVVTRSATAGARFSRPPTRMNRVVAALKRAGVEDRDIQTSNINLNPEYTLRQQ